MSLLYSRLENLPALLKYSAFGSGPLTSLGGVEGVAFVSTRFVNASLDWPDIEFHFVSGTHASDGGSHLRHALGLRDEYWSHYFSHLVDRDQFSILAKLMRPRSRGVVELRSADPYEYPKVPAPSIVYEISQFCQNGLSLQIFLIDYLQNYVFAIFSWAVINLPTSTFSFFI